MTQQSLSDFCDIDLRTIQRIEVWEQNVALTLTLIMAIADALEISISELVAK